MPPNRDLAFVWSDQLRRAELTHHTNGDIAVTVWVSTADDQFSTALQLSYHRGLGYKIVDIDGNHTTYRRGFGSFLMNTLIQYLKRSESEDRIIYGNIVDRDADPPGHPQFRRDFYSRFGFTVAADKLEAQLGQLSVKPTPLPMSDSSERQVVPIEDFQSSNQ